MLLITILVERPGQQRQACTVEVQDHETNEQIAYREALRQRLPLSTVLVVNGEHWGVMEDGGGRVERFHLSDGPEPPRPGEIWRPKDKRRKSGFRVKAVHADRVEADDGRTIKLDRMRRYERVG